jgi:hypothetical protein
VDCEDVDNTQTRVSDVLPAGLTPSDFQQFSAVSYKPVNRGEDVCDDVRARVSGRWVNGNFNRSKWRAVSCFRSSTVGKEF